MIENSVAVCSCGSVSVSGVCEGNVLKRCLNGTLVVEDCASKGMACEKPETKPALCVDKDLVNNCGAVTEKGICDGNTVKKCVNKSVVETVCSKDQSCMPASGTSEAYCKDNSATGCGSITEKGICEGKTLKYCSGNEIITELCSNVCVVWDINKAASCAEPCPAGYPEYGTCVGEILQYCDLGTDNKSYLSKVDCGLTSTPICGFDAMNAFYTCINASPCRGYTQRPICVGNELWSCKDNEIQTLSCAKDICMNIKLTSYEQSYVYGYCTAPCGENTDKGICVGNVVKYCLDGRLHIDDCNVDVTQCEVNQDGFAFCLGR